MSKYLAVILDHRKNNTEHHIFESRERAVNFIVEEQKMVQASNSSKLFKNPKNDDIWAFVVKA